MQSNKPGVKKALTAHPVGESAPVAALIARARALNALDQQLRQQLPDALRRQCTLATVESGRIVFLASSPAWASKLRFHQNAILSQARTTSGLPIEKFAVKVAPIPPVQKEPAKRAPLSKASALHLQAAARSLVDPDLRAIYLRLASLAE